jgi:hypothetical protein
MNSRQWQSSATVGFPRWGRPPGLRESSRTRFSRDEIQPYPGTNRPTWTSAAGLESCPTVRQGGQA